MNINSTQLSSVAFFPKKIFLLIAIVNLFCVSALFSQQNSGQPTAVTISEYTDFLNCIAATDSYGVYNVKMGKDEGMGPLITRSGNPGSYTYTYHTEKASFPITYVSWLSAIRYCNWKSHHGAFGLQSSATTETGSYDLTAFDQGADISTIILTPGANYFLPTSYLIDTTFQDSNNQACDPYFASNRLGFCIAAWTSNASADATNKNESNSPDQERIGLSGGSSMQGNLLGVPSMTVSKIRDANSNDAPSAGTLTLRAPAPDANSNQINISLTLVGAPNNAADGSSGTNSTPSYGFVLMPYQIGRYDVKADEYCVFLNSVAKTSDPHQLYNTNMTSDRDVACIIRSGDTNSGYTYTPINGREKFPITYVSWYSALRFCNWLENNQPTGGQTDATTEKGAYDIAAIGNWTPKPENDYSLPTQPGAAWGLPTENQWYKAAYYMPSTNKQTIAGTYCLFGTGSLNAPGNKWEDAVVANQANYSLNGIPTKQDQPHLTQCGYFQASASPWGAYDMLGEVSQWTSTLDQSGASFVIRGGSWKSQTSDDLKSTSRFTSSGMASSTVGFRVVYNIPPTPVITHLDMMKDLVGIGNPNNDSDQPDTPGGGSFGKVATAYQIEKYDVTAEQYCMFLNAVASHSDPKHLYHPQMTTDSNVACIIRYGNTNRGYSYFPWPGREKFPITYVNFFGALRFCNWLENNQPVGDESATTTESGSSYYDEQDFLQLSTNKPKWLLPTENQWYKAAYCSSTQDGTTPFYYSFGTSSYLAPNNSLSPQDTNSANYCLNGNFTIPTFPHLTPVGAFAKSKSPFGLYDMAGEVNQWTLTPLDKDPHKIVTRGGSWASTDFRETRFSTSLFVDANTSTNTVGFRVVYNVPPPSPALSELATTICHNVKTTLLADAYALADGTAATNERISDRFFGYITGPFIAGIYKWAINVLTLIMRDIVSCFQKLLTLCLPEGMMNILNGWFRSCFNFFFKSLGPTTGDLVMGDFAELSLWESVMTSGGEYVMLTANPPLAAAILLSCIFTYAAYENLQQKEPRAGIAFASLDIGYIIGVVKLVL